MVCRLVSIIDDGIGYVVLYPSFLNPNLSDLLLQYLLNNLSWASEGNREAVWYGLKPYSYSRYMHEATQDFDQILWLLLKYMSNVHKIPLNGVLCNLYRNGRSSIGPHSDDERELGLQPNILSLSLGSPRWFTLRNKTTSRIERLRLPSGSLLHMAKYTQKYWVHSVPADSSIDNPRINLTFRFIY